jgi:hypothetical protein
LAGLGAVVVLVVVVSAIAGISPLVLARSLVQKRRRAGIPIEQLFVNLSCDLVTQPTRLCDCPS